MNQEKIGKLIKDIRKKNNLSQEEFAKKYGVTYQAVSKWENGKNMPDIEILKQICDDYNIRLDSLLNSTKKRKINFLISIILVICLIVLIIFFINKNDNFEFKTISASCNNFLVTGSIAYNQKSSSIYISHIDYCGGNDTNNYEEIECMLIEKDNNEETIVDKCNYEKKQEISLEDFLATVDFKVDKYEQSCKKYSNNTLYLKINAKNNGEEVTYEIPLKLESNCK